MIKMYKQTIELFIMNIVYIDNPFPLNHQWQKIFQHYHAYQPINIMKTHIWNFVHLIHQKSSHFVK